jgi:hypothetical protein
LQRFIATFDLHFGWERRNGHKIPLHDPAAWAAVMKFAQDFKPHIWIWGGDALDCGAISHHNKGKPGRTEGMRLAEDAEQGHALFIKPVEEVTADKLVYLTGNHEDWLNDFVEDTPTIEGLVDLKKLLRLNKWTVIDQGGMFHLGKLTFLHGDAIKGGEHIAKKAVTDYERSVRFGHHHTYQTYTKVSPIDYKNAKTGIAVPCLCTKSPKYGEGAPNRWVQGFLFGYLHEDGSYNDFVVTIINGRFVVGGRIYHG